MRCRLFPLLWLMAWPVRLYLRFVPLNRGKGLIKRWVLLPLLPPSPHSYVIALPTGGRLWAQYREEIGLAMLLNGGFEAHETRDLCARAWSGAVAVDVGANIGVFTIPLARVVGPQGKVLAFEPVPENARRLQENIELNRLKNVHLYRLALSDKAGEVAIHLADDPALHSTGEVVQSRATGVAMTVSATTLDRVWQEAGRPPVSALKIDVEGAELGVLKGSKELLEQCHPPLLVEANSPADLDALVTWLSGFRYSRQRPAGFESWNHLFTWNGSAA